MSRLRLNVPQSVFGTGLILGTAGFIFNCTQELLVRRRPEGFERVTVRSSSKNIIQDHWRDKGDRYPVFVLLPGLSATSAVMAPLGEALDEVGSVLLHERAGYGGSLTRSDKPFSINEAIDDLNSVIDQLGISERDIFVVGHSLGAYIAWELSRTDHFPIKGIFLLDPLHPMELVKSPAQSVGAKQVDLNMRTTTPFMPCGFGALFNRPLIVDEDHKYRHLVDSINKAASTWKAGKREWLTMYAQMIDGKPLQYPNPEVACAVIIAEQTLEADSIQAELFAEFNGERHVLPGVAHMTMLFEEKSIQRMVELIQDMVGGENELA